jgi:hypothetical protein
MLSLLIEQPVPKKCESVLASNLYTVDDDF